MRVLERNPSPLRHNEGAGIVAGDELQEFVRIFDATHRPIFVASRSRHFIDRDGSQIHQIERLQQMTSWDLLYCLLRANFDGMKSEYCEVPTVDESQGDATYSHGCAITQIRPMSDRRIEVEFQTGEDRIQTEIADLLIGADGHSSTVRKMLLPEIRCKYVGYVAWRGTVSELEISEILATMSVEKISFFQKDGFQMIAYTIPGEKGSLKVGNRLINWVWYCNYLQDSREYIDLMTDSDGVRHQTTLPTGKVNEDIWKRQKGFARAALPPPFAELVEKTKLPFVQSITDVISPKSAFYDGRIYLVGDALAGFRPHTGSSTNQAAFNALKLDQFMRGSISQDQFERDILEYATRMQQIGVELGQESQFNVQNGRIDKAGAAMY